MRFSPHEYNFLKVCSLDSLIVENESNKKILRRLGQKLKELFFWKPNSAKIRETDFLFFKSMKRDDYDILFNSIFDSLKSGSKFKYEFKLYKTKLINLYAILFLVLNIRLIFTFKTSSLLKNIYLYITAVYCIVFLEDLIKSIRFKYLVTFADMQPLDNLITQYSKLNSIPTITLQHGLYIDYNNFRNVNMVNYQNVISDYFLAWGADSETLIKKYHPKVKIVVCGKPIKGRYSTKKKGYFTVVFDQNLFHEFNKKILEVAYEVAFEIGLKVNIKLHPYNKSGWYKYIDEVSLFDMDIFQSEFIIGHTTSLLYELMRMGIPAFKLKSDIPSNNIKNSLIFSNSNELIQLYKYRLKNFDFREYAKIYVEYLGDESLNKYSKFFSKLGSDEI